MANYLLVILFNLKIHLYFQSTKYFTKQNYFLIVCIILYCKDNKRCCHWQMQHNSFVPCILLACVIRPGESRHKCRCQPLTGQTLSLLKSCKDVAVLFLEKSLSHSDSCPDNMLLPLCTELTLVWCSMLTALSQPDAFFLLGSCCSAQNVHRICTYTCIHWFYLFILIYIYSTIFYSLEGSIYVHFNF